MEPPLGGRLKMVSATAPADGETPALDALYLAPVASAGLRWDPARGAAVTLNVLGGFRAPNLDDYQALGSGARSFDTPNGDLGPERSYTVELGLRWARGPLTASVWAHGSRLDGLVARVPSTYMGMSVFDGRRVYTRENASEAWMAGAEAEVSLRSRWGLYASVGASYTWAEAAVPDDDGAPVVEPMAKVPPAFGRVAVGVRRPWWWVDAILTGALPQDRLARSDRDDVRLCPDGPDACASVPGWASVALRLGARANDHVTVALAVENVFGASYTPYGAGFAAPGVNVISQVRVRTR
ncbi:MAG: TonB-dependent receptor [Polyangiales bacterium]